MRRVRRVAAASVPCRGGERVARACRRASVFVAAVVVLSFASTSSRRSVYTAAANIAIREEGRQENKDGMPAKKKSARAPGSQIARRARRAAATPAPSMGDVAASYDMWQSRRTPHSSPYPLCGGENCLRELEGSSGHVDEMCKTMCVCPRDPLSEQTQDNITLVCCGVNAALRKRLSANQSATVKVRGDQRFEGVNRITVCGGVECSARTSAGDTPMLRCTKCKVVNFCSRACQTRSWPGHRRGCNRFAKFGTFLDEDTDDEELDDGKEARRLMNELNQKFRQLGTDNPDAAAPILELPRDEAAAALGALAANS